MDIVDGEESAFLNAVVREKLNEDRLCWSIAAPDPNPVKIDIYPGEKQALDIVRFHPDKIEIPSEQGWSDPRRGLRSRVFLRKGRYEGGIHIVAKNTLRRSFDLLIDVTDKKREVTLTPQKFVGLFRVLISQSTAKRIR